MTQDSKTSASPRVIVALDFADKAEMMRLVERVRPDQCRLKVGKELFTRHGPGVVRDLVERGFDVFLDLKYHDIPNTVARACTAAADLGVWMLNVHALGGRRMMAAAREALDNTANPPLLIAVTVLTSMVDEELREVGLEGGSGPVADRLAVLAREEGLDGVVCSAREAPAMRTRHGAGFRLVTPGIRLAQDQPGDQRRVMTPAQAVAAGADYLVVGRSITHSGDDPVDKIRAINSEIDAGGVFS